MATKLDQIKQNFSCIDSSKIVVIKAYDTIWIQDTASEFVSRWLDPNLIKV